MKKQITKKSIIRGGIELALLIGMIIVFIIINKNIDKNNEKKEREGYRFSIDSLVYDEKLGEINTLGWIIKEEVSCPDGLQRKNLKMILAKDGEMDEVIEIPLESYLRQDVNKLYGNGNNDYSFCGFKGSVKTNPEILQNKYRIIFQYDSDIEKYYYTVKYFENGELKTEITQWD